MATTNDVLTRLLSYAPTLYQDSSLWWGLMTGEAQELSKWESMLEDIGNQLLVDTATWGLDYYESELGIPVNHADSYDVRRQRAKAKMKGGGTATPSRMLDIVKLYVEDAQITYDVSSYFFSVKVIRPVGVPATDADLKKAIDNFKPAHLGYAVLYTHYLWGDVTTQTWGSFATTTWGDI